jgi:hypothetical protein
MEKGRLEAMSIVGRVEKWLNQRNAVAPEDKTRLLNERIARLFPEAGVIAKSSGRRTNEGKRHDRLGASKA